jgi:Uma2 family endonuclease
MGEAAGQTSSAEDYLTRRDWAEYELTDGILSPRHGGGVVGAVGVALGMYLTLHCRPRLIGHIFGVKCPYRCFPGRPHLIRRSSVSVVRFGRLPDEVVPKGFMTIAPDLAVEVVSPNDLDEEVEAKVNEYLTAGVKLVWVVSPGSRTVLVRRPDDTCSLVREAGELSGEGVVPGFTCKVAELFV